MFDLHNHILPGLDDGASELSVSLDMARAFVDQGVQVVACTPHILPGLYHNSGSQIREAVVDLQNRIDEAGIALQLVTGADNHVVGDFVEGLRTGHLLTVADTRYVLVEPPHHVAPARLEDLFFNLLVAGYVPILTHPERLTWIESKYGVFERLAAKGVWMQVTCGSLRGKFGRRARYWGERMLGEGIVHILASDAHDLKRRPPDLLGGYRAAEKLVGSEEATHLVATRPYGILQNESPGDLPAPKGMTTPHESRENDGYSENSDRRAGGGVARRLQRFFGN